MSSFQFHLGMVHSFTYITGSNGFVVECICLFVLSHKLDSVRLLKIRVGIVDGSFSVFCLAFFA